jgi:PIN domain nuclease of toxin-antitoxin system
MYLLDTHLLLWAAGGSKQLSQTAIELLDNPAHELAFSAASLWEITIKQGLGRTDFKVDAQRLHRQLLLHGYQEITISSLHALAVGTLPTLHKDPFDRLLLAQAHVEGLTLLTHDHTLAQYGEHGERVLKV